MTLLVLPGMITFVVTLIPSYFGRVADFVTFFDAMHGFLLT